MGVAKPSQMRLRGKAKPSLGPSRDVGSICRKYLPHLPPQAWWQQESVHRWLLTWLANPPPCSGICNTGAELPGCSLRPAGWDICHCFSVYSIAANVGFNCSDCTVLRTVPRGPTYPGRSVLWLPTSQCFLGQIHSLAVLFWCQSLLFSRPEAHHCWYTHHSKVDLSFWFGYFEQALCLFISKPQWSLADQRWRDVSMCQSVNVLIPSAFFFYLSLPFSIPVHSYYLISHVERHLCLTRGLFLAWYEFRQ